MDYYKILCIIAIIICIIFCYYIYNIGTKNTQKIQDMLKKLEITNNQENKQTNKQINKQIKIEKLVVKHPKYDENEIDPYFDIFIDNEFAGKIIFQLFNDIVPKTCANFKYLCSHNISDGKRKKPSYKNTQIDLIKKDNHIIGGTSINYSIYGRYFKDESFELEHNQPGLLAMYNDGKNKNNSKFMIILDKNVDNNGKYVVFGIIKSGYEVIEKMNDIELKDKKCFIKNCGLTSDE